MADSHRIQRLKLEFIRNEKAENLRLDPRLKRGLLQILDEVLSEWAPRDRIVEIPRLVVNMPPVPAARFKQKFLREFRKALKARLGAPPTGSPTLPESHMHAPLQKKAEALLYFLGSGRFPWWFPTHPKEPWEAVLGAIYRSKSSQTRALLNQVLAQKESVWRLAHLLDPLGEKWHTDTGISSYSSAVSQLIQELSGYIHTQVEPSQARLLTNAIYISIRQAKQHAPYRRLSVREILAKLRQVLSKTPFEEFLDQFQASLPDPESSFSLDPKASREIVIGDEMPALTALTHYLTFGSFPLESSELSKDVWAKALAKAVLSSGAEILPAWLAALERPSLYIELKEVLSRIFIQFLMKESPHKLREFMAGLPAKLRRHPEMIPWFRVWNHAAMLLARHSQETSANSAQDFRALLSPGGKNRFPALPLFWPRLIRLLSRFPYADIQFLQNLARKAFASRSLENLNKQLPAIGKHTLVSTPSVPSPAEPDFSSLYFLDLLSHVLLHQNWPWWGEKAKKSIGKLYKGSTLKPPWPLLASLLIRCRIEAQDQLLRRIQELARHPLILRRWLHRFPLPILEIMLQILLKREVKSLRDSFLELLGLLSKVRGQKLYFRSIWPLFICFLIRQASANQKDEKEMPLIWQGLVWLSSALKQPLAPILSYIESQEMNLSYLPALPKKKALLLFLESLDTSKKGNFLFPRLQRTDGFLLLQSYLNHGYFLPEWQDEGLAIVSEAFEELITQKQTEKLSKSLNLESRGAPVFSILREHFELRLSVDALLLVWESKGLEVQSIRDALSFLRQQNSGWKAQFLTHFLQDLLALRPRSTAFSLEKAGKIVSHHHHLLLARHPEWQNSLTVNWKIPAVDAKPLIEKYPLFSRRRRQWESPLDTLTSTLNSFIFMGVLPRWALWRRIEEFQEALEEAHFRQPTAFRRELVELFRGMPFDNWSAFQQSLDRFNGPIISDLPETFQVLAEALPLPSKSTSISQDVSLFLRHFVPKRKWGLKPKALTAWMHWISPQPLRTDNQDMIRLKQLANLLENRIQEAVPGEVRELKKLQKALQIYALTSIHSEIKAVEAGVPPALSSKSVGKHKKSKTLTGEARTQKKRKAPIELEMLDVFFPGKAPLLSREIHVLLNVITSAHGPKANLLKCIQGLAEQAAQLRKLDRAQLLFLVFSWLRPPAINNWQAEMALVFKAHSLKKYASMPPDWHRIEPLLAKLRKKYRDFPDRSGESTFRQGDMQPDPKDAAQVSGFRHLALFNFRENLRALLAPPSPQLRLQKRFQFLDTFFPKEEPVFSSQLVELLENTPSPWRIPPHQVPDAFTLFILQAWSKIKHWKRGQIFILLSLALKNTSKNDWPRFASQAFQSPNSKHYRSMTPDWERIRPLLQEWFPESMVSGLNLSSSPNIKTENLGKGNSERKREGFSKPEEKQLSEEEKALAIPNSETTENLDPVREKHTRTSPFANTVFSLEEKKGKEVSIPPNYRIGLLAHLLSLLLFPEGERNTYKQTQLSTEAKEKDSKQEERVAERGSSQLNYRIGMFTRLLSLLFFPEGEEEAYKQIQQSTEAKEKDSKQEEWIAERDAFSPNYRIGMLTRLLSLLLFPEGERNTYKQTQLSTEAKEKDSKQEERAAQKDDFSPNYRIDLLTHLLSLLLFPEGERQADKQTQQSTEEKDSKQEERAAQKDASQPNYQIGLITHLLSLLLFPKGERQADKQTQRSTEEKETVKEDDESIIEQPKTSQSKLKQEKLAEETLSHSTSIDSPNPQAFSDKGHENYVNPIKRPDEPFPARGTLPADLPRLRERIQKLSPSSPSAASALVLEIFVEVIIAWFFPKEKNHNKNSATKGMLDSHSSGGKERPHEEKQSQAETNISVSGESTELPERNTPLPVEVEILLFLVELFLLGSETRENSKALLPNLTTKLQTMISQFRKGNPAFYLGEKQLSQAEAFPVSKSQVSDKETDKKTEEREEEKTLFQTTVRGEPNPANPDFQEKEADIHSEGTLPLGESNSKEQTSSPKGLLKEEKQLQTEPNSSALHFPKGVKLSELLLSRFFLLLSRQSIRKQDLLQLLDSLAETLSHKEPPFGQGNQVPETRAGGSTQSQTPAAIPKKIEAPKDLTEAQSPDHPDEKHSESRTLLERPDRKIPFRNSTQDQGSPTVPHHPDLRIQQAAQGQELLRLIQYLKQRYSDTSSSTISPGELVSSLLHLIFLPLLAHPLEAQRESETSQAQKAPEKTSVPRQQKKNPASPDKEHQASQPTQSQNLPIPRLKDKKTAQHFGQWQESPEVQSQSEARKAQLAGIPQHPASPFSPETIQAALEAILTGIHNYKPSSKALSSQQLIKTVSESLLRFTGLFAFAPQIPEASPSEILSYFSSLSPQIPEQEENKSAASPESLKSISPGIVPEPEQGFPDFKDLAKQLKKLPLSPLGNREWSQLATLLQSVYTRAPGNGSILYLFRHYLLIQGQDFHFEGQKRPQAPQKGSTASFKAKQWIYQRLRRMKKAPAAFQQQLLKKQRQPLMRPALILLEIQALLQQAGSPHLRKKWQKNILPSAEKLNFQAPARIKILLQHIEKELQDPQAPPPFSHLPGATEGYQFLPAILEDAFPDLFLNHPEAKKSQIEGKPQGESSHSNQETPPEPLFPATSGQRPPENRQQAAAHNESLQALARKLSQALSNDPDFLQHFSQNKARQLLAELRKPLTPQVQPLEAGEKIYIHNAGLVITWPFLTRFFKHLGLLQEEDFPDTTTRVRGAWLLQQLAELNAEAFEYQLPLNKILVGLPPGEPAFLFDPLRPDETEHCRQLLRAIKGYWPPLKNTSVEGMQSSFFQRKGILETKGEHWQLTVEKKGIDALLSKLNWSFERIKLPWLTQNLFVQWT